MLFLNYVPLIAFATCLVLLSASMWSFRFVRSRRPLVRISVRCLATCIAAGCTATAGLFTISALTTISSRPIYSPERKHALRVDYADSGALGGVTSVTVYSDYGFHSEVIFLQEGRTVDPENVRWISDSEVLVPYSIYSPNNRPQIYAASPLIKIRYVEIPTAMH